MAGGEVCLMVCSLHSGGVSMRWGEGLPRWGLHLGVGGQTLPHDRILRGMVNERAVRILLHSSFLSQFYVGYSL